MGAALTVIILLAITTVVVRIASVVMEHSGLTQDVARFQCLSALTGTGFTTHESEMIVNYPVRRKVLVTLMVLGNLGLVTISATFIVAFVDVAHDTASIIKQMAAFAAAIGLMLIFTLYKPLDNIMCGIAGRLLSRTNGLARLGYHRVLQLDNEYSIAEHKMVGVSPITINDLSLAAKNINLLAVHGEDIMENENIAGGMKLSDGDTLVCYGSDDAHEKLSRQVGELRASKRVTVSEA